MELNELEKQAKKLHVMVSDMEQHVDEVCGALGEPEDLALALDEADEALTKAVEKLSTLCFTLTALWLNVHLTKGALEGEHGNQNQNE